MKIRLFCLLMVLGLGSQYGLADAAYTTPAIEQFDKLAPHSKEFTRLPLSWKVLEQDREKAKKAWDIIREANKDQAKSDRKLHVVYVTFKDRPFLPEYVDRYDHILKNIQAYYADQMKENGFPPLTFALDLDENGKLVVHTAHVDQPMSEMTVRSSGPVSREAAKKALADKGIDAENNHILVICQLEDGIGPYYGGGYFKNGTGWTCDQADLDPRNFLSKEYFGGRYKQTVGGNATIYIGGTAHELGHAFGLPHTRESWLYPDSGRSLMGSGNHTYGQDLRNESKGSYLAPSDALMLASVPLFSGMEVSGKRRFVTDGAYEGITFSPVPYGAVIDGAIKSDAKCYGVVVHLDPPGNSDYDAITNTAVPDKDGKFSLEVRYPGHNGYIDMRVTALYTDGTKKITYAPAWLTEKGLESPQFIQNSYFTKVLDFWIDRKYEDALKELDSVSKQYGNIPEVKAAIPVWERVLSGKRPELAYSPANAPENVNKLNLVDSQYIEAKAGWGVPCWDVMFPSELGPQAYFRDGGAPERFMLVHAVGVLKYDLGGKWNDFEARFGLPCGKDGGSVQYEIYADGKLLRKTKVYKSGDSELVKLPVKGVRQLEIRIQDAGDGNTADWAVIANPVLTR